MFYNKKGFTPLLRAGAGFTLVELMLVVIIIGVLVAMVVPRLTGRSEEARQAAAFADINANISLALELYEMDNSRYPENLGFLRTKSPEAINWNGPYLKKKPVDPWGRQYVYKFPGEHNKDYDLYSLGFDGVEGGGDDIVNWEEEGSE